VQRRATRAAGATITRLREIGPFGDSRRAERLLLSHGFDPESVMIVSDSQFGPQMIRKQTTDWPTYQQVFVKEDYRFDHPAPKTIVDLGANVGYSAVYYHARYPQAHIVAVEPGSENAAVARVNVSLACVPGSVDVVESAIWHSPAHLKITNPDANAWALRVNEADPDDKSSFAATTMPMLMTRYGLDTIDLVKIDIEAGERYLFAKNTEWLDHVNEIVIELHDRFTKGCRKPVIDALERHWGDYDEVTQGENTLFSRRRRLTSSSSR
jgi:FkbM family methyltransferase